MEQRASRHPRRAWWRRPGPADVPVLALCVCFLLALGVVAAWGVLTAPLTLVTLLDEQPAGTVTAAGAATAAAAPPPGAPAAGRRGGDRPTTPGRAAAVAEAPPAATVPATAAEVSSEIDARVSLPPGVRVTQKQVDAVAQAICDGFADGYSYDQVKEGVRKAGSRYGLRVSDADADWAVRQAVASRCPEHRAALP